jgi:phosphoserine phosphatase
MAPDDPDILVTVTGTDRPGIAARLASALGDLALEIRDVEQVRVRGQLLLCVELAPTPLDDLQARIAGALDDRAVQVSVTTLPPDRHVTRGDRHLVTVLAPELTAARLHALFARLAGLGANIERIVRLAAYPVTSYELTVRGGDPVALRRELAVQAAAVGVDVAVARAGLHRRAQHLIALDADSTLLQGEVIDALAARAGCAEEVAGITAAAMAGQLDFT